MVCQRTAHFQRSLLCAVAVMGSVVGATHARQRVGALLAKPNSMMVSACPRVYSHAGQACVLVALATTFRPLRFGIPPL
ncbi:hypothetical protein JKP88DRAFT_224071, partial [Tribonema minus]